MNNTVSIVIPTFNRAALLPRAIDSALAQTLPAEVIVCDHGSSDDTPTVAARYGDAIRYIRRERDQGPIVCWREGVESASGELVHFNFDDDWSDATFLDHAYIPGLRRAGDIQTAIRAARGEVVLHGGVVPRLTPAEIAARSQK